MPLDPTAPEPSARLPRRGGVPLLLDPDAGARQARQLVQALALGSGAGGFERLRASLLDAQP